jgi:hypothetical protein
VSAIVAAHGGTVSAQAQIGAGTTFVVYLPITPMTSAKPTAPAPVAGRVNDTDLPRGTAVS